MPITHTKVSTVADGSTAEHIRPSDWNADHTIAGSVILSSGVASSAPLVMPVGTLLTNPTAGAIENDGNCFYVTPRTSSRYVVTAEQFITVNAAYTLSTVGTVAQKLFNGTTNGALNIAPNRTYLYESQFSITNLQATGHTVGFGFGGTASVTRNMYIGIAKLAAGTTAGAANIMMSTLVAPTTTAAGSLVPATTLTQVVASVNGKIVIDTSGTLIPSIIFGGAATVASVVGIDSYFRIWPIGSTAVASVGDWS
jgi:2-keto-3-deoxy-6-phosphogluconate aldolase